MIVRRAGLRSGQEGGREWLYYSDAGGLTHYGAYVETLQPGARSSDKHWHEKEDEFLYVLAGEVTVIEDDGEAVLHPGDAACWPAGKPVAHTVANRSARLPAPTSSSAHALRTTPAIIPNPVASSTPKAKRGGSRAPMGRC